MGVLTMEIEKMNNTAKENQKQVEKLIKKLETEKKDTSKEYEKNMKEAVERDCINCMKQDFEAEGFEKACINLQLISTREAILKNVAETEFERQYLDDNYERIFNKVKKIYANNEKAKSQLRALKFNDQEQLQQEEVKKPLIYKILAVLGVIGLIILLFLKWALIFGIAACIFVFILICMCAKDK